MGISRGLKRLVIAAAACLVVLAMPMEGLGGKRLKRHRARSGLTAAHEGSDPAPRGTVTVSHGADRKGRSVLILRGRRLDRRALYIVYIDDPTTPDPTPEQVAKFRTNRRGSFSVRLGSKLLPIPFEVTATELAGGRIEIRDLENRVILAGVVPSVHADTVEIVEDAVIVQDNLAPTADAGEDATVECTGGRTAVMLDGAGSSDPEGADLTYVWTGGFAGGTAEGAAPTVHFTAAGLFRVTLVVSDGVNRSEADTVEITIADTLVPTITAPDDVTVECTHHRGQAVRLGTPEVSDTCDPDPTVTNDAPDLFQLGTTLVTWTVEDASGNTATDTQNVTVEDTTPPRLAITNVPTELWPPDHRLVRITPRIQVQDACDPRPAVTVRAASSEPDNGTGDGNTTGDIVINTARDIQLRAERSGQGSGRIYTLVWTARDASGNATTFRTTLTVPHDQGNGNGRGADDGDGDDGGDESSSTTTDQGNGNANGHSNGNAQGHGNGNGNSNR